jgi:uncharacterized protein (DUF4415 family)
MTKKEFQPGRGYIKSDWDAVGSSEATDEQLVTARPFAEAFPELSDVIWKRGPQRKKEAVSIRIDIDVLQKLRATGSGWQSHVNDVLRGYVEGVM